MRRWVIVSWIILGFLQVYAQIKPYTLASESKADIETVLQEVTVTLEEYGFDILGVYTPAEDNDRRVLVFSRTDLLQGVGRFAGLNGFYSALRVGITHEDGATMVSYTTPEYWANAYLRENADDIGALTDKLNRDLVEALCDGEPQQYGSEKGLTEEKLRKYRYMMGMPQFDDTHVLATFNSHSEAVSAIDANIASGLEDAELVYAVEVPGRNIKLFGFGISGEDGEASFMPVIDVSSPKHTAFLPYELLVVENEVHMLHGRFRIALSFPDLTMGTFMKIVSTPKDIKRILEEVCTTVPAQ